MEVTHGFSIAVAENGWIVSRFDPWDCPTTVRIFPTKEKVLEYLNKQLDVYAEEWDEMIADPEENIPFRDKNPEKDFPEQDSIPECLVGQVLSESETDSQREFYTRTRPRSKESPRKKKWWAFWKKD